MSGAVSLRKAASSRTATPRRSGVLELRPGVRAGDDVVGLARDGRGHAAAQPGDAGLRLVAGHLVEARRSGRTSFRRAASGPAGRAASSSTTPTSREVLHRLLVGGLVEEEPDRLGDPRADPVDLGDLLHGGARHAIDRAEVLGQEPGRALADEADAEGVEDAGQPAAPGAGDRVGEVGRRLLGQPLELGELGDGEPVEVGEVADQPALDELVDDGLAQVLDVHGPARPEVEERLLELRGAGGVRAADDDLALRPRRARAADGTPVREDERARRRAGRRSARTLTMCGITSPARSTTTVSPTRTSRRCDLVGVVERGVC